MLSVASLHLLRRRKVAGRHAQAQSLSLTSQILQPQYSQFSRRLNAGLGDPVDAAIVDERCSNVVKVIASTGQDFLRRIVVLEHSVSGLRHACKSPVVLALHELAPPGGMPLILPACTSGVAWNADLPRVVSKSSRVPLLGLMKSSP